MGRKFAPVRYPRTTSLANIWTKSNGKSHSDISEFFDPVLLDRVQANDCLHRIGSGMRPTQSGKRMSQVGRFVTVPDA